MRLTSLKDWGNPDSSRSIPTATLSGRGFRGYRHGSNNGPMLILAIALFWLAIFSSVVIFALKDGRSEQVAPEKVAVATDKPSPEMVEVLVPVKDIDQDKSLEPAMFMKIWRPKSGLPPNIVTSYDQLRSTYAKTFIVAHQPLARDAITKEQPINPVIGSIPEGFRAVTININATSGVEGWARAGATVDIQWISDINGRRSARLLVPNAKILSAERQIDPHAEPGAPIPTTVTLLVGERDAQKVSLAQTAGSLVLHLRGANDPKESQSTGTLTLGDLLGHGGDAPEGGVEGMVRVKDRDGNIEEFAVMGGKVLRKR